MPAQAFVLVGDNPASISYVRGKGQACEEAGILSQTILLPESTSEAELLEIMRREAPSLFGDYDIVTLADGTQVVRTEHEKV